MFSFFKKKKKEQSKDPAPDQPDGNPPSQDSSEKTPAIKKKRFPFKRLIILFVVLVCLAAAGFVVYKFYFSKTDATEKKQVYQKQELKYVKLPEEMIRFSFDHLNALYLSMIDYNAQMILFDMEISRIQAIADQYPEQKKIADKEIKIWLKARDALQKAFNKIEKPVKETYVLFRVNKKQGLALIESQDKDLAVQAQQALAAAKELTSTLKPMEKVPEGMIRGTVYKLKKKFL